MMHRSQAEEEEDYNARAQVYFPNAAEQQKRDEEAAKPLFSLTVHSELGTSMDGEDQVWKLKATGLGGSEKCALEGELGMKIRSLRREIQNLVDPRNNWKLVLALPDGQSLGEDIDMLDLRTVFTAPSQLATRKDLDSDMDIVRIEACRALGSLGAAAAHHAKNLWLMAHGNATPDVKAAASDALQQVAPGASF